MRIRIFGLILFSLLGCNGLLFSQSYMDRLVEIGADFYVDTEEISNIDWKEHLYWLARHEGSDSLAFWAAYPDTSVWLHTPYPDTLIAKTYFSDPAYNDYPVVGISYAQAQKYCQWRGDRIREVAGPSAKMDLDFRLPTLAEWYLIRRFNHPDLHYQVKKKDQGKAVFNARDSLINITGITKSHLITQLPATVPTRSFLPSKMGIYNLYGNVAEMIAEQGVAVGGSFHHSKKVIYSGQPMSYTEPTHWLGFRCVAIASHKKSNLVGTMSKEQ